MSPSHFQAWRAAPILALVLAAAAPALPRAALAAPAGEDGCSAFLAAWQSAEGRTSALGHADLGAFNDVQNAIDRAAHLCEGGDGAAARRVMDATRDPGGVGK